MEILSEKELKNKLLILKNILKPYNKKNFHNVRFINIDTFYSYINNLNNKNIYIEDLIKTLEIYIPFKSCEDTEIFYLFETAFSCYDKEYIKFLKNFLYKKSIINFLNLLSKANTQKEFLEIFKACNNIRKSL